MITGIKIGDPATYVLKCYQCGFQTSCLTVTICPNCEYLKVHA